MIYSKTSYPIIHTKKRVDLVLQNISTTGSVLKYKGNVQIGNDVDFGTSVVTFEESDPFILGDLTASGEELYVIIGDTLLSRDVTLNDNSELIILDNNVGLN